jgi:hypothetical protein
MLPRRLPQHCRDRPGWLRVVAHGLWSSVPCTTWHPAVPADVGACLAAIRHEEGQRERDAAHGTLGNLQRPQIPLRRSGRFRQDQPRTARMLLSMTPTWPTNSTASSTILPRALITVSEGCRAAATDEIAPIA